MTVKILRGDCRDVLRALEPESVHCVVTSPPYWGLRDYGVDGQIGLEHDFAEYIESMVMVFREVKRVLRSDGTVWLNLGDSYAAGGSGGPSDKSTLYSPGEKNPGQAARDYGKNITQVIRKPSNGLKPKDLCGIPWRLAFALQADGWWLRSDIIWSKKNPMPESVTDRPTKAHEYLFLLAKSERYYYDAEAIKDDRADDRETDGALSPSERNRGGRTDGFTKPNGIDLAHLNGKRNKRSVWEIATQPFPEAHFATFPPALIEPCIKAGCPAGGTVLDPFGGAGTTGLVADRLGRNAILIELNPEYAAMAERRIRGDSPLFAEVS